MAPALDTGPPFTATDSVDIASFQSMMEQISSNLMLTLTGGPPEQTRTGQSPGRTTLDTVSTSVLISQSSRPSITASSISATDGGSASQPTSTGSSSGASAANSSDSGLSQSQNCDSISCSPGLQAAVAVPIVVVLFAVAGLLFFCAKRRKSRRRQNGQEAVIKEEKPKKKWSRHLRIFSFDTELLMGGRHSSTNSIRSRQTGSARSQGGASNQTPEASVHSVDEVAPPYRDAISSAQPPAMSEVGTGTAAAVAAGGVAIPTVIRPDSRATAPPPYAAGSDIANRSVSSSTSGRNPFSDSHLAIPNNPSPFSDPPGEAASPALSRGSSMYRRDQPSADDVSSVGGASDAASIHEARLGRNASVVSRGRVIDDVRRSR